MAATHVPSVEERVLYLEQDLALMTLLATALAQAAGAGRDVDISHPEMSDAWEGVRRRCEEGTESLRAIRNALGAKPLGEEAPPAPAREGRVMAAGGLPPRPAPATGGRHERCQPRGGRDAT